jgi:hypothetical protein
MSNTKMRISFEKVVLSAGVPHKRKVRDQPHRYFRVVSSILAITRLCITTLYNH